MTQAWANVTSSPECIPMAKEERQKLASKLKCNSFQPEPSLDMQSLDDLFFHYKSLQLKDILDCKKKNVDCYLSEEQQLRHVVDYFMRMQLANSKLFFKLISDSLSKQDRIAIDNIVSDDKILPLIPKDNPCKFDSILGKLREKKLNHTKNVKQCIQENKYFLKVMMRDNFIARQLDDFVGTEGTFVIFDQINKGMFDSNCRPYEIVKEQLKVGLRKSRLNFEGEENRIARSCVSSTDGKECFYKPIFPMKNLLINIAHPNSKTSHQNIESDLDPQLLEKYYCHLNRTYGASYDDLNETAAKVIPYAELVFFWRAILGRTLSKVISQSPSIAIPLVQLNKRKFTSSMLNTAGTVTSRTGDLIIASGAVLEAQKLSQACLNLYAPKAATGSFNEWDTNNCSCRNQHRSPITDKNYTDCQVEVLTLLIEEALEPLAVMKDSLSAIDTVAKDNLVQEVDTYLNVHLSKTGNYMKEFAKPEFLEKLDRFVAQYNTEKYRCP